MTGRSTILIAGLISFVALGGVGVGAPDAPRQHSGLVGARRVRFGLSGLALHLAGMDRQVVWMVDCVLGACAALDRCQDQGAGDKCNKGLLGKWVPNRLRHCLFVASP